MDPASRHRRGHCQGHQKGFSAPVIRTTGIVVTLPASVRWAVVRVAKTLALGSEDQTLVAELAKEA